MGNSIFRNSLYNLFYRGFNLVYPVVTTAYISRIFLADGVGEIAFVINIVTYFTIAASLGIPNYAIKALASVRHNQVLLSRRFTELAVIIFISSLVATLLYYLTAFYIFGEKESDLQLAMVLGLMVITNISNYDWLFEAMEDFRYLAYRSIVIKSIALLFIFLLVKELEDILTYCLIYAGITIGNNLWNLFSTSRYVKWCFRQLSLRKHLIPVFTLFAATFATEIYTLLDSTMLGVLCPPEYLGYYSNASRINRAAFGIIFAAIAVFNPRLNYVYHNKSHEEYKCLFQRFYNIGMYIAIPSASLLFILAPQVITLLFGEAFAPAILSLRILSCLLVVFTLASIFGHIGLIIYGKEKVLLYAAIVAAVTNFSLNQLLIPLYMHNGAAISSVISEMIVAFLLVVSSMRCCKIKMANMKLTLLTLLSIATCMAILWIEK